VSADAAGARQVLPDEAYAAALLGLPALWPARLGALLGLGRRGPRCERGARRSARTAWELVRRGRAVEVAALRSLLSEADPDAVAAMWAAAASRVDVGRAWAAYRRLGARVDILGDDGYPARLAGAPGAPYVLFRSGSRLDLDGRTAAVVGTRRCTPAGRAIASEFGGALAGAGVRVVSGLALGVDGAAHQGALDAGPGTAHQGAAARSGWSPGASTGPTPCATASSGSGSPPPGPSCPNGRWGHAARAGASPPATASSWPCPRWSWSWSRASGVGRW